MAEGRESRVQSRVTEHVRCAASLDSPRFPCLGDSDALHFERLSRECGSADFAFSGALESAADLNEDKSGEEDGFMTALLAVILMGASWDPPPPTIAKGLAVAPGPVVYAHGYLAGLAATRPRQRPTLGVFF